MYQVNQMSSARRRIARAKWPRRTEPLPLPESGSAEVSIVAGSPEAARQIAAVLRTYFTAAEQHSYSEGSDGTVRLRLNVNTVLSRPSAGS